MIQIDGSRGEGGGQILRTSLALALLTQQPVRLFNIRARRAKPGLMRQHLTGVLAAARIGAARLAGAELRSQEVVFEPQLIQGGHHHFKVGTAGSAALVLQTVLPALLRADAPSTVVVEGGTHASMAPPFDFLDRVFAPAMRRMGAQIALRLEAHGFYPAGGGRIVAEITPGPLRPLELLHRGAITSRRLSAIVSNLPTDIGAREIEAARARLDWSLTVPSEVVEARSPGPGNVVFVEVGFEGGGALFTGFGRKGRRAEQVATEAADEALRWRAADVPVDEHLADQLLLPMVMAGGGAFRTTRPSLHTSTQVETLGLFLATPVRLTREAADGAERWRVVVG